MRRPLRGVEGCVMEAAMLIGLADRNGGIPTEPQLHGRLERTLLEPVETDRGRRRRWIGRVFTSRIGARAEETTDVVFTRRTPRG
jgi:hypothetical protein